MESYLGTWEVEVEKNQNIEGLAQAMGFTPERTAIYKQLKYRLVVEKEGDKYKAVTDYLGAGPNQTFTFSLGEEIDFTNVDGFKAKMTVTEANGEVVENYVVPDTGVTWKTVRSFSGDTLTSTSYAKDQTAVQLFHRV